MTELILCERINFTVRGIKNFDFAWYRKYMLRYSILNSTVLPYRKCLCEEKFFSKNPITYLFLYNINV